MEAFQRIVLVSALVILVICLIFIGIALSRTKLQQWPPVMAQCPDYWDVTTDASGGVICTNTKKLGSKSSEAQCLTKKASEMTSDCDRYKYATGCGVTWDGITYGMRAQPNPCDAPTPSAAANA